MVVLMLCYFIRIMDPTSSLGWICLGENVYGSSSEKVEGHGDWDAPEYTDTAGSKEKKVTKALSFYKMETDELCLDYEVKKRNKVVKKELIVALKGELYFFKFIINPKEDDMEPEVIIGRSFMRLVNGIVNFGRGVITVYPEQLGGEELPPFVCKMGKSSCNKKRAMENLNLFYPDIGPSSSTGRHLTQEEAVKEALALRISQKFALLEEVRPVLETMAYNDKYNKVLDEIWKDKVELDGMIMKEEEEAINKVKGEALKEKDDPGAFICPIKFEGKINENALVETGSDINTMPYRIYEKLGREEIKKVVGRGFLYIISGIVNTPERLFSTFDGIYHQTFRAARSDVLRTTESDSDDEEEYEIKRNKFGALIYGPKPAAYLNCNDPAERSIALQAVINPFWKISVWKKVVSFLGSLLAPLQHVDWKPDYKGCYTNEEETKGQWRTEIRLWEETMMKPNNQDPNALDDTKPWKRLRLYHADELDEEGFDVYFQGGLHSDDHFNAQECWLSISREENLSLSRSLVSNIRSLVLRVIHKMITYGLCQRTNRYDKIQKNDLWLLSMFDARHQNRYANVAWLIARWMKIKGFGTQKESQICCGQFIMKISRKARVLSDVDLYDRMGSMEIRQEANERMEYMQSYHWDKYAGVFEHMAGVYSVDLQGAYNLPGYA
ncbi:hypothetical protein Tco_0294521 [Tanacetum coccineum]